MGYYKDGLKGNFEQNWDVNKGVRMELLDACAVVAMFSRTYYRNKSYGGLSVYKDEKISICLDTYVPNISVTLRLGEAEKNVFSWNHNGFAQSYRPGKWEEYVLNVLYPAAAAEKKRKDDELIAERAAEHQNNFGPIEDGDLFP